MSHTTIRDKNEKSDNNSSVDQYSRVCSFPRYIGIKHLAVHYIIKKKVRTFQKSGSRAFRLRACGGVPEEARTDEPGPCQKNLVSDTNCNNDMTTKLAGQQSTTTTHRKFSRPWYSDNHVAMTKRTPNTTDMPKRRRSQ